MFETFFFFVRVLIKTFTPFFLVIPVSENTKIVVKKKNLYIRYIRR